MRTYTSFALLGALLLAGAGTARAGEAADAEPVPSAAPPPPVVPVPSPSVSPPPQPEDGHWYGATVWAFDGAMLATSAGCIALSSSQDCLFPVYGYLLGGPIIHGRHHGWSRAFASVGLRVGLPLAGGLMAMGSGGSCSGSSDGGDYCGLDAAAGALVGVAVGMAAAIVVDGLWAYDDAPPPGPSVPLALSPALSFRQGGGAVGLLGRF